MHSLWTVFLLAAFVGWVEPALAQHLVCQVPGGSRITPDGRNRAWIASAVMEINPENLTSPDWKTWGFGNISSALYAPTAVAKVTPELIEISAETNKEAFLRGATESYSIFRLTIDRETLDAKITEQLVPVGVTYTWLGSCGVVR